jgi:hypothetical protein
MGIVLSDLLTLIEAVYSSATYLVCDFELDLLFNFSRDVN